MGTSVSPGEPNQITMLGSVQIGIVLLVLTGVTTAKDVFRYEDEETGQSHYMTGKRYIKITFMNCSERLFVDKSYSHDKTRKNSILKMLSMQLSPVDRRGCKF